MGEASKAEEDAAENNSDTETLNKKGIAVNKKSKMEKSTTRLGVTAKGVTATKWRIPILNMEAAIVILSASAVVFICGAMAFIVGINGKMSD